MKIESDHSQPGFIKDISLDHQAGKYTYVLAGSQIQEHPLQHAGTREKSQWLRLNGTYILRCSLSREIPMHIHVCTCKCCAFLARLTYMYLLHVACRPRSGSLFALSVRINRSLICPKFSNLLLLNRSDIGGGETPCTPLQ
jgi:hypothetical protein